MIALYDYENSLNKKIQYERQDAMKVGDEKRAREDARYFYSLGISAEEIAKGVRYPLDTVRKWLGLPS